VAQPDFIGQKGRLQEELEAANQTVMFYPKFHCELNFIERFWCAAKCTSMRTVITRFQLH
jgi:hypothetical protein